MQAGRDVTFGEILVEFVTPLSADNDVQVIVSTAPTGLIRCLNILNPGEKLIVATRQLTPACVPFLEMWQFDRQQSCLESIQTSIITLDQMVVLSVLSMVADHSHALRQFFIVGRHRACLTACPQV